ncbi:MAG TPA: hypothetical protein VMJ75_14840, partial [Candidatus Acidoferrales bacterium]|nr:hypothetical protein [Candidatus Acidoferrales bacterium]HTT58365.1 hypothetical protein [Opitutaceae bacterium]
MPAWLFLGALFVLCGVLGVLQYLWIGEVDRALRDRLRGSLQTSLNRASLDFNAEIAAPVRAMVPLTSTPDADALERSVLANLPQTRLFERIAVVVPRGGAALSLRILDREKRAFDSVDWPEGWKGLEARLISHLNPGQPPMSPESEGLLFETP